MYPGETCKTYEKLRFVHWNSRCITSFWWRKPACLQVTIPPADVMRIRGWPPALGAGKASGMGDSVQLPYKWLISMVYGRYNKLVNEFMEVFSWCINQHSHKWFPHPVAEVPLQSNMAGKSSNHRDLFCQKHQRIVGLDPGRWSWYLDGSWMTPMFQKSTVHPTMEDQKSWENLHSDFR